MPTPTGPTARPANGHDVPLSDPHELTDGQLLQAARDGGEAAWTELVQRFTPMLWRVTRGFRLDQATSADVVQAVWLALAEHAASVRDPQAVRAWLASTARRCCLKEVRRRQRMELRDSFTDAEQPPEVRSVEDRVATGDRDSRLWRAVQRLGERDRVLLSLLIFEPEMSYTDISQALGMPVGSIGPTRGRCLARLRRELTHEGLKEADLLGA
jgi:RNA polymerase sigma factor (sigma-70 family)